MVFGGFCGGVVFCLFVIFIMDRADGVIAQRAGKILGFPAPQAATEAVVAAVRRKLKSARESPGAESTDTQDSEL
jgi:hypothetical protein